MREGPYEVKIVGRNGVACTEERIAGMTHIRAVEGEEYKVKVEVHQDEFGTYPFLYAIINLSIDGVKLSHHKQMDMLRRSRVTFDGYRKSRDIRQSFVFSSPSTYTSSTGQRGHQECGRMGSFEVAIFEAEPSNRMSTNLSHFDEGPILPSVQEDKKFWQQASLGTTGGLEIRDEQKSVLYNWNKLRQDPDATLTLHYHTPEMIDFLAAKHLQRKVFAVSVAPAGPPVHIDLSTQRKEMVAEPTPAPVIDLMHDEQVKVKRERTSGGGDGSNKRRRSSLGSGSSSGAPPPMEVVDLC